MSNKILTAEDIMNESDSDSDSSSQSQDLKPLDKKQPATPQKKAASEEEEVFNEQPEVDNRYANLSTCKSAEASYKQRFNSTGGVEGQTEDPGQNFNFQKLLVDEQSDDDTEKQPDFNNRRQSFRTNQSESFTYKSFQAATQIKDDSSSHLNSPIPNMLSPMGKGFDSSQVEPEQEMDDAKILAMIENESNSDDDDQGSGASNNQKAAKSNGSMVSEEDLLNRSLQSEGDDAIDPTNYLRYASDIVNQKFDILEIVDKNERSFKHVAEKMVLQSSQLISIGDEAPAQQRRLTHQKINKKIMEKFSNARAQGEPTCIASFEEYLCIGSSDGSVRLYDSQELEIKCLQDKSVKGIPVTCIDVKRVDKAQNIFVVCGHSKGQITVYELKGLLQQWEMPQPQAGQVMAPPPDVEFKHRKTVEELHKNTIVSCKFVGDLNREILIMSSDITGLICTTQLIDSLFMFRANQSVFEKGRLGPTFSMAPMVHLHVNNVFPKIMQSSFNLFSGHGDSTQSQYLKEQIAKKLKEVAETKFNDAEAQLRSHIVAFGSLDEVYVSQIKPQIQPLLSVKRPAYIASGSVPYLDWGLALTPTYRDQAYPCLAIAWGNAIQLAVFSNQNAVNQGLEAPTLVLDGFYICDGLSIDSVFFLSESLIFIIVNKKDVRILYTPNFTPGVYDEELSSQALNTKKVGASTTTELEKLAIQQYQTVKEMYAGSVSSYAEKDSGYKMVECEMKTFDNASWYQMTSEQGPLGNFNATVCKNYGFNVTALGKTQLISRNLIHWEEYLDLIRRTSPDFLKVLKAALDIFNGKMIGLAGLPDQKEKREQLMRERMKDLLRQNINACIKEFKEGQNVSEKTLKLATEFCIRVGAIDHLFGELFKMFADSGVESIYFENLDAFILSGKLKQIKIPNQIVEKLIKFYRNKDIQLLEQALLNINLTKYPGAEEVRFMCEEEQLSSALIHILTTIFRDQKESDSTTCLSILCSLFNIMLRAKCKKSEKDVQDLQDYLDKFPTSVFELSQFDSDNLKEDSKQKVFRKMRKEKIETEHSGTYIGYKILWLVTLYLEGKKYPQGNLTSLSWRYYVMDIVRFCTNEKFMQWFLDFDPDSFFAILKKVFNDPEPFEFITNQDDFIAKHSVDNPFLEPVYTHTDILTILTQKVAQMVQAEKVSNEGKLTAKAERIQNAFMFFLTQIARNKKITITKTICQKIVKEQIAFHKTLYRLPKKDLLDLVPDTQGIRKDKDKAQNIYTYLIKRNEKDVIQVLVQYCSQLSTDEISALLEDAKSSPLFKLKIYLYQLQGDFQKCLTLFFQIKAIKSDVFAWLQEIQHTLKGVDPIEDSEVDNDEDDNNFFDVRGIGSRITLNKMKDLITKNILDFATMDPGKTVNLCEQWFDQNYMQVAEELKEQKEVTYSFLSAVLLQNENKILKEYNQAVMMNNQAHQISDKYKGVLLRLVELLAEKRVKNHSKLIVDFVSRNYFPIDECLKVCEKRGAIEACAVLYRRKGNYKQSIKLYIQTLTTLCVEKLIHTISFEKNIQFEDPLCTNEHMSAFDYLVQQIIKICAKYGARQTEKEMEDLWMYAIKSLFEVKTEVFKKKHEMEEPDSDSDSSADRERHEEEMQFERFVLIRNQVFLAKMSEHVDLRSVIQFLEQCGHAMKYDDFRKTFEEKIETELYFINILNTAIKLTRKEVGTHTAEILIDYSKGYKTRSKCDGCQRPMVNKFDRQDIWVMSCQHSFHARCIVKSEGQCQVCFNELDVIHSFQQLKKDKSFGDRRGSSKSKEAVEPEQSDVDSILQKRGQSLKRSITLANQQMPAKRRLESREDRINRAMGEFEIEVNNRYLFRHDFLMI